MSSSDQKQNQQHQDTGQSPHVQPLEQRISSNADIDEEEEKVQSIVRIKSPTRSLSGHSRGIPPYEHTLTSNIRVTRQRTSIRRIFTWFSPEFRAMRARTQPSSDAAPLQGTTSSSVGEGENDYDGGGGVRSSSTHIPGVDMDEGEEKEMNGDEGYYYGNDNDDNEEEEEEDNGDDDEYDESDEDESDENELVESIWHLHEIEEDRSNEQYDKREDGHRSRKKSCKTRNHGSSKRKKMKKKKITTKTPGFTMREEATSDAFASPAFKLRAFKTDTSQSTDVVVIYTNAIRYHTRMLFSVMYCIYERGEDIEEGDIKSFFIWFEDYHDLFCHFITIINTVFLPALIEVIPFRHRTPSFFSDEGQRLNRLISKTLQSAPYLQTLYENHPQKALQKLFTIFKHDFSQQLCLYLYIIEKYAAAIYNRFLSNSKNIQLSKTMATALKELPNFQRSLPMLLRWLEYRPRTTCAWLAFHYDYVTVRLYRLWRRPTEHENTLDYFRRKAKSPFDI